MTNSCHTPSSKDCKYLNSPVALTYSITMLCAGMPNPHMPLVAALDYLATHVGRNAEEAETATCFAFFGALCGTY